MPDMNERPIDEQMKRDIGRRLRHFRESIGKTQQQLAEELNINQSTITNIEVGNSFPKISYLAYFYHCYKMNIHWLFFEEEKMFIVPERAALIAETASQLSERYSELAQLMEIPVVEQVILAKLTELKALLKDEIREFKARKARSGR